MNSKRWMAAGLAALIGIFGLGAGVNALAAPAESTPLLPYRTSEFYVLTLPPPFWGNLSYAEWQFPNPEIEDESAVLRMGGDITTTQGAPLGAILLGTKTPDETPIAMGLVGEGEMSFQFNTCEGGKDLDFEPINDRFKTLIIPKWVVERDFQLKLWTDDDANGGAGEAITITSQSLTSTRIIEMVGILLPTETTNLMSAVESQLADVWDADLGNYGAMVLGWKNSGPARGVALTNAGIGYQSLQVPPCQPQGGEWVNDLAKIWFLASKEQVLASSNQPITLNENDLPGGDPGLEFSFNLGDFRQAFLKFVYLPLINR